VSGTIRLLIVDDHPVVRAGVRGMLESQPDFDIAGEASSGQEAVALARRLRPDVVLMDLRMQGELDGVAAIRSIRAEFPAIQVLVLTTYDSDAHIVPAVESGAIGYLLKDAPREELFRGVRAAARGQPAQSPRVAARLEARARSGIWETLSARELEVLQQAAAGRSSREIGRTLAISEATVKSHLLHIYRKLGVSDRTAAVTTALERGMIRLAGEGKPLP
jgi:DNA-binding NarL/FixJ family response regulator